MSCIERHRVYDDIATTKERLLQTCVVLDYGAVPNFFNLKNLLKTGVKLKIGGIPTISDANVNILQIVGTVTPFVLF